MLLVVFAGKPVLTKHILLLLRIGGNVHQKQIEERGEDRGLVTVSEEQKGRRMVLGDAGIVSNGGERNDGMELCTQKRYDAVLTTA